MDVYEGQEEPIRGWVGRRGAAPQVVYRYKGVRGWTGAASVVIVAPYKGETRPRYGLAEKADVFQGWWHHIAIGRPGGGADHVSWSRGLEMPVDDGRPFNTDATLVWLRTDKGGKPVKCFMVDGSHLDFEGREVFAGKERKSQLVRLA